MPLNNAQIKAEWGPKCATQDQLTKKQFLGIWVTIRKEIVEAVECMAFIMAWYNWAPEGPDTGAMNCRLRTGSTTELSNHSWGTAIDIDWLQNGYGKTLVTNMPRAMVDEIVAMRTNSGHQVWRWGGDWDGNPATGHSVYDAMHYEICCTKAQIATGIAGFDFSPTVPDPVRPPIEQPKEWDETVTEAEFDAKMAAGFEALEKRLVAQLAGGNAGYDSRLYVVGISDINTVRVPTLQASFDPVTGKWYGGKVAFVMDEEKDLPDLRDNGIIHPTKKIVHVAGSDEAKRLLTWPTVVI